MKNMKRYIILVLSISVFLANASAQSSKPNEGFDGNGKKVKLNRQQMLADELQRSGSYYNAIDIYLQDQQENPSNYTTYQLAHTYYMARDYKNAETWFKKVVDAAIADYPLAQYYYAMSLKMNAKYDMAITEFAKAQKAKIKGSDAAVFKRMAKNESKGCELAKVLTAEPLKMEVYHLGANINNNYTDFSPTYDPKTQDLVYASLVSKEIIDLGASKKVELKSKIFTAKRQGSGWTNGKELTGPFNETSAQVGNGAYSPDGKRFYFTQCEPNDQLKMECKIYMSILESGEWSKPKPLSDINAGTGYTTTHPTVGIAKGGKEILYFSSNREGTVGGMDIWYSEIKDGGSEYTAPQNCGRKINTTGDEITPFYSVKNERLYFSSNGLINIGGFDVFETKGSMKSWENALNVGVPVNTSVDDFYYTLDNKKARTGFLVSNRPGGFSVKSETCCDDIYEIKYIVPPVFTIMGNAINKKTNEKMDNVSITLFKSGANVDQAVSSKSKMFEFFRGSEFEKYKLTGSMDGFFTGEATVSTVGMPFDYDDTLYVDIIMEPLPVEIQIKNIYYELDKADIRPESGPALDSLFNILSANPALIVEIGSHTDSRNTNPYNIDLSQRRAQAVVSYLKDRGIDTSRMQAKGYGEEVPYTLLSDYTTPGGKKVPIGTKLTEAFINKYKSNKTDFEYLHQINRRTEFRILGEIPGANIRYDANEIDAKRALDREAQQKEEAERNKKLLDLQSLDEGEVIEETPVNNTNNQQTTTTTTTTTTDTKTTETKTSDKKGKEDAKPAGKAGVDPALVKKGTLYEGSGVVNGEDTKYVLNPNPNIKMPMISDEFYVKLRDAGAISESDIKNDKPTSLSDGTTVKGDVLTIKTLQLGETVFTNVDAKISTTITQNIVVGAALLETNGCSIDTKNLKLKCK
jgi:outer membrane protein OmpA-like peptidoglycan-associated protein/tetratricopeptide (TPR) repeat protein